MRILITGICGFVGSSLASRLLASLEGVEILGLDNLWRPGSETNRSVLREAGVRVVHGDVRAPADFEALPAVDWLIDAAANASVLAGVDGATTPRQLVEHNLSGTLNMLEHCRRHDAGLVLLSSSRVYSLDALRSIPLVERATRFAPGPDLPPGVRPGGICEDFPAGAPASLYGTTKLASEQLALEYGSAFDLPVWIDRCGVLAGAGQFGQAAQGIFSWWVNRWQKGRPLSYIGFGGRGLQVRDCLHPDDLADLLVRQLASPPSAGEPVTFNVGGGEAGSMSLAELSAWCAERFGPSEVGRDDEQRAFDVPWVVLDSGRATARWSWTPRRTLPGILDEIADHATKHPDWLTLSEG